jgi:hypothetical protein
LVETRPAKKFSLLIKELERRGCLHRFDGTVGACRTKINLLEELKKR